MIETREKRRPKTILLIAILFILLCLPVGPCWASHAEVETPDGVGHTFSQEENILISQKENMPIPFIYKVYWIVLISMVILIMLYFFLMYRKEKYQLIKPLTLFLILLACFLYFLEQGRIFAGYFDPVRHVFIPGYHEANSIGFLRFVYKLAAGIALCAYGLSTFLARQKDKVRSNGPT